MNQYHQVAGYHTPTETEKTIAQLRADFPALTFHDEPWHNDAADRIEVKGTKEKNEVSIWVPNPAEGFNEFGLTFRDDDGETDFERGQDWATYEELCEALRTII